jgi:hypothetical protein
MSRASEGLAAMVRRAGAAGGGSVLAIAAVFAAVTGATAGPATAAARPVSDCTATTGAIVAVDFAHWGGPVLRSCGTTPTTGYALLNQGGWDTTGTEHDGPGFICRIGYSGYRHGSQYPTAAQQACVDTPPASAYWAFWQAAPGQDTWTYSQLGAMSYHPSPGSVSLWIFGGTNLAGTAGSAVPPISPDSLRTDATRAAAAGTPAIVDAQPVAASASASRGSGSPWPSIIAVIAALLLVAAGVSVAMRRRRLERS